MFMAGRECFVSFISQAYKKVLNKKCISGVEILALSLIFLYISLEVAVDQQGYKWTAFTPMHIFIWKYTWLVRSIDWQAFLV